MAVIAGGRLGPDAANFVAVLVLIVACFMAMAWGFQINRALGWAITAGIGAAIWWWIARW
ncbi:hypothetical protein D3874_11770 [Oleomonas cavernae]|uniref:Uncharacterized protein n=1 Tax=Oleomonas cavernae TaxID=2320859 RepID=A0A418WCC4_9PROT|nr:hypothetical protein [Oleomonas cavernae]RJF87616.1 hypothetical protein D3874_11770 [Oleomonas cavernae]